jgi:hypothetical protein
MTGKGKPGILEVTEGGHRSLLASAGGLPFLLGGTAMEYQRILVCLDGSQLAERILHFARFSPRGSKPRYASFR